MTKAYSLLLTIMLVCISAVVYGELGIQTSSIEVMACDLPSEVGPCDGGFPRYYYNSNSGTCELFSYGGCGGTLQHV